MKKEILSNKLINTMKDSKIYLGSISVLFILVAILAFKSITKPVRYEEKITASNILQKTNITYSTEALPNGMSSINGTIFSRIPKNMKVHIILSITSENPVFNKR